MHTLRRSLKDAPENNPWHPRALHRERDKIRGKHISEEGQEWQPLIKHWYEVK